MKVRELIEALSKCPSEAEVLVSERGDPTVGVYGAAYKVTDVWNDAHWFVSGEEAQEPYCDICGIIKEAHDAAPVAVFMEVLQ